MEFESFENYFNFKLDDWRKTNLENLISGVDDERIVKCIKKDYNTTKLLFPNLSEQKFVNDTLQRIHAGDPCTCMLYLKDPLKQNIAEKTQIEYLQLKTGFYVQKLNTRELSLNASGRIIEGNVQGIKSIDFIINARHKYYGFLKYTKENGGAQDNQCNDALHFIEAAILNQDPNTYFLIGLDGDYYQRVKRHYKTSSLIRLQNIFKDKVNVCINTTDELIKFIMDHEQA